MTTALPLHTLRAFFSDRLRENTPLAPYTSARIGGPADALLTVHSGEELREVVEYMWGLDVPFSILGNGSNVLISDRGVRGMVIINRAKAVRFEPGEQPKVWAESGITISNLAHRAASKGLSGLEWAANIPGTLGGAIYGNAGAFGNDIASTLIVVELLCENGFERWPVEKMNYGYRTSLLKQQKNKNIILAAEMQMKNSTKQVAQEKIHQFSDSRKDTQPPGASMGSMFKNPPGDHAGRLIEAAGLKGTRIGNAVISPVHANFFINKGKTKADDVRALIELARSRVEEMFGINLELEIEFLGEW